MYKKRIKLMAKILMIFTFPCLIVAGQNQSTSEEPNDAQGESNTVHGSWSATAHDNDVIVIEYEFEKDENGMIGLRRSNFNGLTTDAINGSEPTNFKLVKEQGTLSFNGVWNDNQGSGTVVFEQNRTFTNVMTKAGFPGLSWRQSLFLSFHGESSDDLIAFARDLKELGFGEISLEQLYDLCRAEVYAKFAREIHAEQFADLQIEHLIVFRENGVTPEKIRMWRSSGEIADTGSDITKLINSAGKL